MPDRSGYDHRRLGAFGEERALRWYLGQGYDLLDRNWRCPQGEIDLVLWRDGTVVFCEVKTRSSTRFGSPFEAVGRDKQRRLRRLGSLWLAEASLRATGLRFDVAAVTGARVEVLEGAF